MNVETFAEDDALRGAIMPMGKVFRAVLYRIPSNYQIDTAYFSSRDEALEWVRALADFAYKQIDGEELQIERVYLPRRAQ